jgi:hypothetical protein
MQPSKPLPKSIFEAVGEAVRGFEADMQRSGSPDSAMRILDVLEDVAVERERQILKGYDAANDDTRCNGSLLAFVNSILLTFSRGTGADWVWDAYARLMHAQKSERQRLVMAAAVLVAEIQRRDRIEAAKPVIPLTTIGVQHADADEPRY